MHPDEAVELALQDLRSRSTTHTPDAPSAHPYRTLDLLRAYFSPLRWYVADGRSPAGDVTETGHLPRPRFQAESAAPAADAALAAGACR
jgi:hypothetical protein